MHCTDESCDEFLLSPQEEDVVIKAIEHSEETDHVTRVTGSYVLPKNGGFYIDGSNVDVTQRQFHEIRAGEDAREVLTDM